MSIGAATLSWAAKKASGEKWETLETGWSWVSLREVAERRGCCCTPRKCTDEVIADVSLQNPKASKISNLSLWEVEIPNKHLLALVSVNIEKPGSSDEQSRTDKHETSFSGFTDVLTRQSQKIHFIPRALCQRQQPTF